MSEFGRRADWSEGRRGSRIDLEEGGRYLGIPQIGFADTLSLVTINPVSTNSGAVQDHRSLRSSLVRLDVLGFQRCFTFNPRRIGHLGPNN